MRLILALAVLVGVLSSPRSTGAEEALLEFISADNFHAPCRGASTGSGLPYKVRFLKPLKGHVALSRGVEITLWVWCPVGMRKEGDHMVVELYPPRHPKCLVHEKLKPEWCAFELDRE